MPELEGIALQMFSMLFRAYQWFGIEFDSETLRPLKGESMPPQDWPGPRPECWPEVWSWPLDTSGDPPAGWDIEWPWPLYVAPPEPI